MLLSLLLSCFAKFVALAFGIAYLYFLHVFTYWKRRKVPHATPSFPMGNIGETRKRNFGVVVRDLYEKFKHERFVGLWFFNKPTLMVNDLDLAKEILVKEFMSFHDHGVMCDEKVDPLSANLFALEGSAWRNLRANLTPTLTSGKLKNMFAIVKAHGEELREVLRRPAEAREVVEVKEIIARFATDTISSCAFGIESNSLRNPDAVIRAVGRKIFEPTWAMNIRNFMSFTLPEIGRKLKVRTNPKEIADFFFRIVRETMEYRRTNNVQRDDFLQSLMHLMDKGCVDNVDRRAEGESGANGGSRRQVFTFEQAVAEAFVFFIAGFETGSTTIQFVLYELALNQDIQDKLREEIKTTLDESGGEITYENIHRMQFLGRVIEETLRLHPPVGLLVRKCTKPYRIPGTDVVIEEGTSVVVPTFGFHMDERHFPNPNRFDPDRFLEESKASRHHFAYLPFGEGPRVCIGQRFAMMQMRVALVTILDSYSVAVAHGRTPVPIVYEERSFVLSSKGGIHLRFSPLWSAAEVSRENLET